MPLIWRGFGIIVPIVFFVTGWIVSFWFGEGETTLGNASFIGWTSLYSGIVVLLIGLVLKAGGSSEDGEPKGKHDFFYIPVFIWGILLGGLSLYLLVFTGKAAPTTDPEPITENQEIVEQFEDDTKRMVNLYNPTDKPLTYIVADDTRDGLISREEVAPNSFRKLELDEGTYLFSAYDEAKETTLEMPLTREIANDKSKYKLVEAADNGESIIQRILNPRTKETDDYDEAWLMLDGKTKMLVVKAEKACVSAITKEDIAAVNWEEEVFETFDGSDLVEPLYNKFYKDKQITVILPGEKLNAECKEDHVYFILVPFSSGNQKSAIEKAIIAAKY